MRPISDYSDIELDAPLEHAQKPLPMPAAARSRSEDRAKEREAGVAEETKEAAVRSQGAAHRDIHGGGPTRGGSASSESSLV